MTKTTKRPSKLALTRRRNAARREAAYRKIQAKTPHGRLYNDGATSPEQANRRLQWLAQEWSLPVDCLPKIGRTMTSKVAGFVEKYSISIDWLFYGDLRGLHRMMMQRKGRYVPPDSYERLVQKVNMLSPEDQEMVRKKVQRLLAERGIGEHEPA
jgi:hypothetical protein